MKSDRKSDNERYETEVEKRREGEIVINRRTNERMRKREKESMK